MRWVVLQEMAKGKIGHDGSSPSFLHYRRPHLKACNDAWRVDETYIKIKKVWMYLYRAVDSDGNTLEFLLSPTGDAEAAKRFFLKALSSTAQSIPQDDVAQEEVVKEPSVEQGTEAIALSDVQVSRKMPRVINVDKAWDGLFLLTGIGYHRERDL